MEFALNTFYLVLSGAFVMWMAAGFTMLEAGLVRSKKRFRNCNQKFRSIFNRMRNVFGMWFLFNVPRR